MNPGESFVNKGGVWLDWSDGSLRLDTLGFAGDVIEMIDPQIDNFPIKGYTVVKPDDLDVQLAGGAQSVVLYVGDDPTTLTLELVGDDADKNDINDMMREWWLVDGGDQLVSLEPVGEGTQAKVAALKAGTTRLVAEVRGLGTLIIPVEVREHPGSDPQPGSETPQPTGPATTKASSAAPKAGDALAPWQAIAITCVSVSIALAAGMRIRRRGKEAESASK